MTNDSLVMRTKFWKGFDISFRMLMTDGRVEYHLKWSIFDFGDAVKRQGDLCEGT